MTKPIQPRGKVKPSIEDCARKLADLRGLPQPAIRAAMEDRVLTFGKRQGLPAWFYCDAHAGSVRRLDGEPWRYNGCEAKACDVEGTSGEKLTHWPVGVLNVRERQTVIVCEGAPDALAAYAVREQTRGDFAIVAMLGASLTIHDKALPCFAGKRVRFIAHVGSDGLKFAERNARRLIGTAAQVSIARLDGIRRPDGNEAGDLCESVAFRVAGSVPDEIARLLDFDQPSSNVRTVAAQSEILAKFPGHSEFVTQEDTRNTQGILRKTQRKEEGRLSGALEELHGMAREFASTRRGQSNEQLFALARQVLRYEANHGGENRALRDAIFDTWFHASHTNLDPQKTRSAYLFRFHSKFRKVRKLPGQRDALKEAEERARLSPLPEIPGALDACDGWRMVAGVMRELQRAAGDAPFFLSTRAAARIAKQIHATEGQRTIEALVFFGVAKCVQKGKAGTSTGKASEYRYLLAS